MPLRRGQLDKDLNGGTGPQKDPQGGAGSVRADAQRRARLTDPPDQRA